jgi:FkbM family methyltransferase
MVAFTRVPGRPEIELPFYYAEFADYYPNCELETKAWFVENAARDWVYLDCGANIGYYSILFASLSPEGVVHAVEPTETATLLSGNIAHHGLANIDVHRIALGRRCGKRVERVYRMWGAPPEEREFEFTTVDALADSLALTRLDCLKIDVDSFDFDVLVGARDVIRRFNPWIVVELNHALALRGHTATQALEWLGARGYERALVLDRDNFVLRRTPGSERRGPFDVQLTMSFPVGDEARRFDTGALPLPLVRECIEMVDAACRLETGPVLLFGAGEIGEVVLDVARARGLEVEAVVDNNASLHGQLFGGHPILPLKDALNRAPKLVLLATKVASRAMRELVEKECVLGGQGFPRFLTPGTSKQSSE